MTDEAPVEDKSSPEARINGLMQLANNRLRERNEALAEAERLKAELATYRSDPNGSYWERDGSGPDSASDDGIVDDTPEPDASQDDETYKREAMRVAASGYVDPNSPNRSRNSSAAPPMSDLELARANLRRAYADLKAEVPEP